MISTKNILPVTTVKRNLMKLLKKLENDGEPVVITKDGRAAGLLISPEDYDGLVETREILSDKELVKILKQSVEDHKKGRTFTHEEVFAD